MKKVMFKTIALSLSFLMYATCIKGQIQAVEYKIQRGESVESIAQAHGVTVDDIIKANPNADGLFYPGMKITIPVKNSIPDKKDTEPIVQAQTTYNTSIETATVNVSDGDKERVFDGNGASYDFLYQDKAKLYGMSFSYYQKHLVVLYGLISNFKFGSDESLEYSSYVGLGLGHRRVYNDNFFIQGKIYPFAGLHGYDKLGFDKNGKTKTESKTEFLYGANADVSVGIKIFDTKKGSSPFLNLGYMVTAGKFKTKGMIKNGMIMVGLTIMFKN